MTRILSYNILLGGTQRVEQLSLIIKTAQADIIGLVEATDPEVVKELAHRLNMHYCLSGYGKHARDWNLAILTRLPILHSRVHTHPRSFVRRHFLEVCVSRPDGKALTLFLMHQISDFGYRTKSHLVRRREVEEMLRIMQTHKGKPHLVMGDFNSLAPGDPFYASKILRYILAGPHYMPPQPPKPTPPAVIPLRRRLLRYTLRTVLNSQKACALLDHYSKPYAEGGIDLLLNAGYTDCFRYLHPHTAGFTFPAAMPACRIDYIFASPELTVELSECAPITCGTDMQASEASDHLPLGATFLDEA
ncbi:hypothetical protein EPA93_39125 [Ktedonosporobacter rubrisoli]|uniref:Endonuclease/exonuclease/phosphatase domain-containing protein n=1 Tax=Ktedonosporobacter rubrisoli TaxID=2509675 RepID=A0A4P6K118_KTERU|nr:endonuclease/exonuclease/phosphatase family protein [Ktedonosporobacter rubrisoli]QBD81665.1 hypothetical protein EPA93_39125 [Ktedonosporobacter rubrisoli]